MAAPELAELQGVLADITAPVVDEEGSADLSAMPFSSDGAAGLRTSDDDLPKLAPERLSALEEAAAKISVGLVGEDGGAAPGGGEWAGVPLGGDVGAGAGQAVGSVCSGTTHRSSRSASSVYSSSQPKRELRPHLLDQGSEERAEKISEEFWKWYRIGSEALESVHEPAPVAEPPQVEVLPAGPEEIAEEYAAADQDAASRIRDDVEEPEYIADEQPPEKRPAAAEDQQDEEQEGCASKDAEPEAMASPASDIEGEAVRRTLPPSADAGTGARSWSEVLAEAAEALGESPESAGGREPEPEPEPEPDLELQSEYGVLRLSMELPTAQAPSAQGGEPSEGQAEQAEQHRPAEPDQEDDEDEDADAELQRLRARLDSIAAKQRAGAAEQQQQEEEETEKEEVMRPHVEQEDQQEEEPQEQPKPRASATRRSDRAPEPVEDKARQAQIAAQKRIRQRLATAGGPAAVERDRPPSGAKRVAAARRAASASARRRPASSGCVRAAKAASREKKAKERAQNEQELIAQADELLFAEGNYIAADACARGRPASAPTVIPLAHWTGDDSEAASGVGGLLSQYDSTRSRTILGSTHEAEEEEEEEEEEEVVVKGETKGANEPAQPMAIGQPSWEVGDDGELHFVVKYDTPQGTDGSETDGRGATPAKRPVATPQKKTALRSPLSPLVLPQGGNGNGAVSNRSSKAKEEDEEAAGTPLASLIRQRAKGSADGASVGPPAKASPVDRRKLFAEFSQSFGAKDGAKGKEQKRPQKKLARPASAGAVMPSVSAPSLGTAAPEARVRPASAAAGPAASAAAATLPRPVRPAPFFVAKPSPADCSARSRLLRPCCAGAASRRPRTTAMSKRQPRRAGVDGDGDAVA